MVLSVLQTAGTKAKNKKAKLSPNIILNPKGFELFFSNFVEN